MKQIMTASLMLAAAGAAHAQSSLTLYGIVDIGINYVNDTQTGRSAGHLAGAHQVSMTDGSTNGLSGSRWGLRGVEDLGGGLKSVFVLENGFSANNGATGQGGAEFGRQAWVGLSTTAGTLTFGRQYDPLLDVVQPFAAAGSWATTMASPADDVNNLVSAQRVNNAVKFRSPVWGGLRFSGLYSFGGVAGHFTQNQIWSFGIGYESQSLQIGAGYLNVRDPNVSFYGNTPNKGLASADNIGSSSAAAAPETVPAYGGYASANTREEIGVGAAYTWRQTTLSGLFANTRFEALGSAAGPNPLGYTGTASFNTAELSVRQQITPAWQTAAAFDFTQRSSVKSDGGAKYMQLSVGSVYSLSKRTDLYAVAILLHATGRDSLGQPAVAGIHGFTPSATDKQVALRLGIRHKF